VIDGQTGILVGSGEESLAEGLRHAAGREWDSTAIRQHAARFSRDRFVKEICEVIEDTMSAPPAQRW
jgi:hypothetical protein